MSCISERVRKVWAREALLQATLLLSVRPRRGGGGGGLSVPCPSTRMWGSWAAPALKGVRAGVGAPAAPRRRAGCSPLGERGGGVFPPPPGTLAVFFRRGPRRSCRCAGRPASPRRRAPYGGRYDFFFRRMEKSPSAPPSNSTVRLQSSASHSQRPTQTCSMSRSRFKQKQFPGQNAVETRRIGTGCRQTK